MEREAVRIRGTGSFLPPKALTNFDLEKMGLDTSDQWIVQRTGISERRIADPGVATSDLGYEASLLLPPARVLFSDSMLQNSI